MNSYQLNVVSCSKVVSAPTWGTSTMGERFTDSSSAAGNKSRFEIETAASLDFQESELAKAFGNAPIQLREAGVRSEFEMNPSALFVANASHEIRNLLGPVIAYSELLKIENDDPRVKAEIIDGITRSSSELMTLVNDLVEMSKMGVGRFEVVKRAFYLRPLIRDIEYFIAGETRKKGLGFRVEFGENVPKQIYSDPCRVKQVLLNLLGNAVKFTERGEIALTVAWDEGNPGKLRFLVRDTGPGIAPDEMGNLFKPFSQYARSARLRRQGAGLGLAISRDIAVSLNGNLRILTSQPGQGTTFEFVLFDIVDLEKEFSYARACPVAHAVVSAAADVLRGIKILVGDDSIESQKLIGRLLQSSGAAVETANDGLEVYKKALRGAYDVILMDIEMPKLGGYEVVRKLRKRGYALPVVAMTGHTDDGHVAACLSAGFNEHLAKPVSRDGLVRVVSKLVHS